MAWNAGVDKAVGELVTAANWNDYLGTAGSLEYLKVEVDRLDASFALPVRSLETPYQNGTKLRSISIYGDNKTGAGIFLQARIGTSSADQTIMQYNGSVAAASQTYIAGISFLVPANWYYIAYESDNTRVLRWTEIDLY